MLGTETPISPTLSSFLVLFMNVMDSPELRPLAMITEFLFVVSVP